VILESVGWFLLVVNIAVFVHELAHYSAARMQGVDVRAFSIGMGPILWRKQWRGTEWRFSALPIGGYVDIDGLAATVGPDGQLTPATTGMARLPWLGKTWILFAGPLSNIVLAVILMTAFLAGRGETTPVPGPVNLERIVFNSPAEKAGLKPGDSILAVNNTPVTNALEVRAALQQDGPKVLSIERLGQRQEIRFDWSPKPDADGCRPLFGVQFAQPKTTNTPMPLGQAFTQASRDLLGGIPQTVVAITQGIGQTFTLQQGTRCNPRQITGPVGTIGILEQFTRLGLWGVMFFSAIINLSLGVFNLLPIPGLDGGRILLSTIVAIRRKPFAPGQEEFINFLGFTFVLAFMGLVWFQDIFRSGG
jgi:regulator of sigma E protease